jgi:hypothetical protein
MNRKVYRRPTTIFVLFNDRLLMNNSTTWTHYFILIIIAAAQGSKLKLDLIGNQNITWPDENCNTTNRPNNKKFKKKSNRTRYFISVHQTHPSSCSVEIPRSELSICSRKTGTLTRISVRKSMRPWVFPITWIKK